MHHKIILFLFGLLCTICKAQPHEDLEKMTNRALSRAQSQALLMARSLQAQKEALPRTFENGRIVTCRYNNWVSGFFPGVLWMLYAHHAQPQLLIHAKEYTARVEPAKHLTHTHDLGFMLMCSQGHAYRITGNPHYLHVILQGTESLLTRWRPHLGVMRSWDFNQSWQFPVIIDNMMNLEMLCFVAKETHRKELSHIAQTHANTTLKHHFRDDYSTYHVVSYDTLTGIPHAKHTAQGYAHHSAWARGQAWGLYGYTMMYKETGKRAYLKQARRIATYLTQHPHMPADGIPYWDFDAPHIPNEPRDASAAAIMASALLQLSKLDKSSKSEQWYKFATKQLRTLSTPHYLAQPGENGGFILKHGVGHLPEKKEVNVPLTYADYYYIEALLLLKQELKQQKK